MEFLEICAWKNVAEIINVKKQTLFVVNMKHCGFSNSFSFVVYLITCLYANYLSAESSSDQRLDTGLITLI